MGWVAFEGPFSPYDWGIVGTRGKDKNGRCLRKIEKLFDRLAPETLVLEAFEKRNSIRRDRVANLGRAIVALAISKGVDVAIHTFNEVRQCFASVGARTRHEIAEAIGRQFAQFHHLMPRKRRAWDAESGKMPLFCAAAVSAAHYHSAATNLLENINE
jgi:Holliday junction resolvasome RuvABC endonuclease subunit